MPMSSPCRGSRCRVGGQGCGCTPSTNYRWVGVPAVLAIALVSTRPPIVRFYGAVVLPTHVYTDELGVWQPTFSSARLRLCERAVIYLSVLSRKLMDVVTVHDRSELEKVEIAQGQKCPGDLNATGLQSVGEFLPPCHRSAVRGRRDG
ncbi:hypothetical protein L211DRAFT_839844 [Terfezia boudieri ATCC MYA-4762]|uniref:Uncharacterized protein n=1 Tax=Terfezia boudieri ATCC MYA-4762 TaxID=1051890 RepID=A0A3N4LHL3_9PEZI|nr:hypothetical protein L211DRAFT_839844 [Terfezia boudieri ATCC MYA-4762]